MAHTENTLQDLKKENLIALVLLYITYCECLDTLYNTVDNLLSKKDLVESSLVVTKTVNDNLLNSITTLERSLHAQEQYSRRECLEIVGIPASVDDKNLQATVCNILNEMFLAAQKIWKIVTESKVTILSPSLAAEENHLRFCMKKKIKKY